MTRVKIQKDLFRPVIQTPPAKSTREGFPEATPGSWVASDWPLTYSAYAKIASGCRTEKPAACSGYEKDDEFHDIMARWPTRSATAKNAYWQDSNRVPKGRRRQRHNCNSNWLRLPYFVNPALYISQWESTVLRMRRLRGYFTWNVLVFGEIIKKAGLESAHDLVIGLLWRDLGTIPAGTQQI